MEQPATQLDTCAINGSSPEVWMAGFVRYSHFSTYCLKSPALAASLAYHYMDFYVRRMFGAATSQDLEETGIIAETLRF